MPEGVNWLDGEAGGEGQGPGDPQFPCLGMFGGDLLEQERENAGGRAGSSRLHSEFSFEI